MSLASYLHHVGCDHLVYRDGCNYKIIDTRLLQSGRLRRKRPEEKTSEELEDWIQNDHLLQPAVQDGDRLEGGLRLLIHKWSYRQDRGGKFSKAPMPFKSEDVLRKVMEKLGVCKSYTLDFGRRQPIPLRIGFIGEGDAQKMQIVCQSPNFRMSFTTITISYDSKTRMTTGFLGYTSGQMSQIVEVLEKSELDVHCNHPLLLPILMYMVAGSMLRRQLRDANMNINHVQRQTGLLDDFITMREPNSKSRPQRTVNARGENKAEGSQTNTHERTQPWPLLSPSPSTSPSPSSYPSPSPSPWPPNSPFSGHVRTVPDIRIYPVDLNGHPSYFVKEPKQEKPKQGKPKREKANYDQIHRILVEQHAQLTSGLHNFVEDLGKGCHAAFDKIEASDIGKNFLNRTVAHQELQTWMLQLELAAIFELQHRQRMLSRVDMQLKVLYNLMQQNIADETRRDSQMMKQIADETLRDSSAMKGIAVVTMIFLPSTALATIFSMSPFFTTTPNDDHLVVSPQFYIFWCIAIPVTVAVISMYTLWAQRVKVRYWWVGKRGNGYQRWRDGPEGERRRGTDLEKGGKGD